MDSELPSGDHQVCPRCGTSASDGQVWCDGCGLNLSLQENLPSADAYAAGVREQAWLEGKKAEQRAAAKERQVAREAEQGQLRQEREAQAEQRRSERKQRSAERRERANRPLRVAFVSLLAFGALLIAAALAWHFTKWDAPLVGVSPLVEDGSESVGASTPDLTTDDGTTFDSAAPAKLECGDVEVTPNSDDVISNVTVSGISCSDASALLYRWGSSGYEGDGPSGFSCVDANRPLDQMTQSTGLKCTDGDEVVTFGGGSPGEPTSSSSSGAGGQCKSPDPSVVDLSSNALPCEDAARVVDEYLSAVGSSEGRTTGPLPTSGFTCQIGQGGSGGTAPVLCSGEAGSEVQFAVDLTSVDPVY